LSYAGASVTVTGGSGSAVLVNVLVLCGASSLPAASIDQNSRECVTVPLGGCGTVMTLPEFTGPPSILQ